MTEFLQQILSGSATGCIYAGLALALVVIYEGTGVMNFAQGELATLSAFLSWQMISAGLDFWVAFALSVAASFVIGVAVEQVFIRPVQHSMELTMLIVSLALMLAVNSLDGLIWGHIGKSVTSPFGDGAVHLAGTTLTWQQVGTAGVILSTVGVVAAFFRFTGLGLKMRAAAMNPASAHMLAINTGWMLALAWGFAAATGAVVGIVITPVTGVHPDVMGGTLLLAFAAFTLGGTGSRSGALVGGLLVGVLTDLAIAYVPHLTGDLANLVPFAVIIAVLLLRPQGLFGRLSAVRS
ncbi:branched-chain amino acid ABC transporter permease [Actinomadura opuntiae]|uniref:branched-chain amino acid ABC transporter permease n=1 Tax=Actinomadura sp. OS1-43 TaxID=604315 RepID=UPI00255B0180|nr:branched-chain amino acid ABC transporter permease [Actinomadura sp. OS1-43]MDL4812676.1 branched-chain amino acid ABC transporter permease [Actinomadura sp. OS1-43]